MKVSEKQLHIMLRALEGTLQIVDRCDMNLFGYNKETRLLVYNQVVNQMSEELDDVIPNNTENNDESH